MLNLCQNAVEAMQPGGRLTVTAGHSAEQVWLEVTDTGEGVSEGLDIFALFMTTKAEGTGLGLAIVQRLSRPMVEQLPIPAKSAKARRSGWVCRAAGSNERFPCCRAPLVQVG